MSVLWLCTKEQGAVARGSARERSPGHAQGQDQSVAAPAGNPGVVVVWAQAYLLAVVLWAHQDGLVDEGHRGRFPAGVWSQVQFQVGDKT